MWFSFGGSFAWKEVGESKVVATKETSNSISNWLLCLPGSSFAWKKVGKS